LNNYLLFKANTTQITLLGKTKWIRSNRLKAPVFTSRTY